MTADPVAEIRRLCAEGTEGHGDEFYGPILVQLDRLYPPVVGDLDAGAPNHTDHTKRGFKPK